MKKALLIVDVQNDFCPGGALGVKDGDKVAEKISAIIPKFETVIASKDWHPRQTVHFEKWPVHCVQRTFGAELHSDIDKDEIDLFLLKGTQNKDDGYSAFEATNVSLVDFLHNNEIEALFVCGLTTDYCVKATALDAVKNEFRTFVINDAIAAVNVEPEDGEKALQEIQKKGCMLIPSDEIDAYIT